LIVRRAKFTVGIGLACILVFALETVGANGYDVLLGTGPRWSPILALGVLYTPLVDQGQCWCLITAGFRHFGLFHLGLNLLALAYVGFFLELRYGTRRFAAICVASLIDGNLIAFATQSPEAISAGASSAILGEYGALVVLGLRYWAERISLQWAFRSVFETLAYGFSHPGIANAAHLGRVATGAAIATLVGVSPAWEAVLLEADERAEARRRKRSKQSRRQGLYRPRSRRIRPTVSSSESPPGSPPQFSLLPLFSSSSPLGGGAGRAAGSTQPHKLAGGAGLAGHLGPVCRLLRAHRNQIPTNSRSPGFHLNRVAHDIRSLARCG
jgi:membrane associated rhomboid family serine protease